MTAQAHLPACNCVPGICAEGDECCESHDCPGNGCQRTDRHDPAGRGGHVYQSAWLGDGHDTTEASDD